MLPIILYSQNNRKSEEFLRSFISTHHINSSHIYKFIPEKTELTVEEVKSILQLFFIRVPNDRLFIFYHFEKASWEIQNMLLKLLEEKKDTNHIILITSKLYSLLSTIRSRAKIVSIKHTNISVNHINEIPPLLKLIIENKKRNPLYHDQLVNLKKEDALKYIDEFIYYFTYKLRYSGNKNNTQYNVFPQILKQLIYIKNTIENNNLNITLAMDNLLLFIEKKINMIT